MTQVIVIGGADRQLEELFGTSDAKVTTATWSEAAGLGASGSGQQRLVAVDVRGSSTLPEELQPFRRQHPDVGVLLVASSLDPGLLLEAMRAGVSEVVPEPVTPQTLRAAIDRIVGQRAPADRGKVFGFVGAKGGVGTTTVAVNTATALGALGKTSPTLLIDLHRTGGDAAVFTGSEPRFSVVDAMENIHRLDANLLRSLVCHVAPHVDLLAAPERVLTGQLDTEKIRRLVAFAVTVYKYVVIDLPRSDGAVLDSLEQLDGLYIVANQELATVKSASRMATMLRQRYGREKVTVVLSRSDRQADIGHADVEKAVGSAVAHTFPSDYRLALQALNKGRPLSLDNHNDLSASFKRFAHQLAGVRPAKPAAAPRGGLLGRFTQRRS